MLPPDGPSAARTFTLVMARPSVAARSRSGIGDDGPITLGRILSRETTERGEGYPGELSERRSRTDEDLEQLRRSCL